MKSHFIALLGTLMLMSLAHADAPVTADEKHYDAALEALVLKISGTVRAD